MNTTTRNTEAQPQGLTRQECQLLAYFNNMKASARLMFIDIAEEIAEALPRCGAAVNSVGGAA